jgi:redox-sensing transcriptional repressor
MERRYGSSDRPLPEPTVARLPIYLRIAEDRVHNGDSTISSEELARLAGVNAAKVRKDLSLLGSLGTRGTGYDAGQLVGAIDGLLGAARDWPVVIAGVGKLGRALINARGFLTGGYRLVGLLDTDPAIVGEQIGNLTVLPFAELATSIEQPPAIGVITTPAHAAQDAADQLVELGARSLLNFAPQVLEIPTEVRVRYVDLSIELQILSYHAIRSTEEPTSGVISTVGVDPQSLPPTSWVETVQ